MLGDRVRGTGSVARAGLDCCAGLGMGAQDTR